MIKNVWRALLLSTLFASAASAQELAPRRYDLSPQQKRPPSGLGGIIVGWAGLGMGAASLAIIPVCSASFYPEAARTECKVGQAILGGGALVASAIGFIVGYPRRAVYREWRATHRSAQSGFTVTSGAAGTGLGYRLVF
jgi:hypothetical protein